jgi:hypothetical protein
MHMIGVLPTSKFATTPIASSESMPINQGRYTSFTGPPDERHSGSQTCVVLSACWQAKEQYAAWRHTGHAKKKRRSDGTANGFSHLRHVHDFELEIGKKNARFVVIVAITVVDDNAAKKMRGKIPIDF